jgi:hypothetical protein
MPYIKHDARDELALGRLPITPGELNYLFSEIIHRYLVTRGERYFVYNEIIGALECCKLELYRRLISPYEDKSIINNGDVYSDRYESVHREATTGAEAA